MQLITLDDEYVVDKKSRHKRDVNSSRNNGRVCLMFEGILVDSKVGSNKYTRLCLPLIAETKLPPWQRYVYDDERSGLRLISLLA